MAKQGSLRSRNSSLAVSTTKGRRVRLCDGLEVDGGTTLEDYGRQEVLWVFRRACDCVRERCEREQAHGSSLSDPVTNY